jgi:ornithine carbamoyltransferase
MAPGDIPAPAVSCAFATAARVEGPAAAMKQKHLISLKDYARAEIEEIFGLARRMKAEPRAYAKALEGKSLAMIFQKPSTRTRVSFEVGMYQLGGTALYLGADAVQLQRGESVPDTARVLSRYVDGIMARVFAHQDVVDLARHGTVPVINGLSDLLHPCQALADYFTLLERRGRLEGLKMAYVGDGNNVCHELMFGAVKLGLAMSVGCPEGYEPNPLILKNAQREAQKAGGPVPEVTSDPMAAVGDADVVYTDVWTSMGQEAESEARVQAFQGFMVTPRMMAAAHHDAVFMHCLPAHRGEEVAAEVMDGPVSVVFDQAENRLHVQKAVMALLMGGSAQGAGRLV